MQLDFSNIRPADISDYDQLIELFDKANKLSLAKSGEPMWSNIMHAHRLLGEHLSKGECHIIKHGDTIAATMTISYDDKLWKDGAKAVYIHKLMKDPQSSIENPGLLFIAFAAEMAKLEDLPLLRCDTVASQTKLIDYYKKLGFSDKGTFIYWESDRPGVMLEADAVNVLNTIETV